MSDQSQGFGTYAAATQQGVGEFVVNLNFGLETTGGLAGTIIPEGMHTFLVTELESRFTSNGEQAAVINVKVCSSSNPEAMNTEKEEWLTIPGEVRKQQSPEKWQMMMRMFRMRLEAITGKHWREDNLVLRGSDILGRKFIATCVHTESKVKDAKTGEEKTYTNADLKDWQALHMQGNGGQQAFGEQPTFAQVPQAAPAPAQPTPAPQPAPAAAPPPANGPGFGFTTPAVDANGVPSGLGGTPVGGQQPNTTYNPAEEPF